MYSNIKKKKGLPGSSIDKFFVNHWTMSEPRNKEIDIFRLISFLFLFFYSLDLLMLSYM